MRRWIKNLQVTGLIWFDRLGPLSFRDIFGIVFIVILLAVVSVAVVFSFSNQAKLNYGFGKDWECFHPGRGGPICIKRVSDQPPPSLKN